MMLRVALSVWGSEDSDSEGQMPCPHREELKPPQFSCHLCQAAMD